MLPSIHTRDQRNLQQSSLERRKTFSSLPLCSLRGSLRVLFFFPRTGCQFPPSLFVSSFLQAEYYLLSFIRFKSFPLTQVILYLEASLVQDKVRSNSREAARLLKKGSKPKILESHLYANSYLQKKSPIFCLIFQKNFSIYKKILEGFHVNLLPSLSSECSPFTCSINIHNTGISKIPPPVNISDRDDDFLR